MAAVALAIMTPPVTHGAEVVALLGFAEQYDFDSNPN